MESDQPLKGYRVLFPRGGKPAVRFANQVKQAGGTPSVIPLIEFRAKPFTIMSLQSYQWLVFTSQNSVRYFLEKADLYNFKGKIAAVGEKTAEALVERGFHVDFIPSVYVAEVFIKEFLPIVKQGESLLFPKGNLAPPTIKNELQQVGVQVDELVVYETYFPKESKDDLIEFLMNGDQSRIVVLTSPSTVRHFMNVFQSTYEKAMRPKLLYAVIGTATQKALQEYGVEPAIMPEQFTFDHLFNEILTYFKQH
ncbi:uroporphyrinogen-III synthase [Bacillus carboniphilus]|uniref:Uroporphyrinogen-III synthase n=1 Tax=Bacillus carboniphilus TaxID=86663 RepID=A0ABN0WDU5_9BACI